MKIFLIVIACVIGWVCCSCLSALIAKALDWDDGETVPVLCVIIAPLFLIIEIIAVPFILLYNLIDTILNP